MGYKNTGLLTLREEEVLRCRLGLFEDKSITNQRIMTLEEVGRIYGVTRERIRQLEAKAIDKLGIEIPVRISFEESRVLIKNALDLYRRK